VLTKGILELFAADSGLRTNIEKCLTSPIQCFLEDTVSLLQHFPSKLSPLPITYLGIPLAARKLKKCELQPLVDKVNDCLPTWKAKLLSKAGRAVLVKAKLSAIPVHTAMANALPPWVIKCIDKHCRAFLWTGSDSAKLGNCLLAWSKVCRPPDLGGLGFLDLELFGYALRMRWLWFKRTDPSRPWDNLPDVAEPLVTSMFHASVSVQIGDRQNSLF